MADGLTIKTNLTELLGLRVPIILAGMNGVAHADLSAAVSNAGGLGVIGGLSFNPKTLRQEIRDLKAKLVDKKLPFGVDLALPKVGEGARKTNHDYTHGKLPELIDIIIEEGASLFVSAVGVPPAWAVEKLHKAGIVLANMVGSPRNAELAMQAGMDILIAQGTEGGGHTGEIGTIALVRQVVDVAKGHKAPINGKPIMVVAAGGIADGEAVAASLMLGAEGVWVGTRFICATESAAPPRMKEAVIKAKALDTTRTLVFSGRPLRAMRTPYLQSWETKERRDLIEKLCSEGTVPLAYDVQKAEQEGKPFSFAAAYPMLMGQAAGIVKETKPAAAIMEEMMRDAIAAIQRNSVKIAKL